MAFNVSRINFALNVGEVSPRFEARQDKTEKYSSACRILRNWLPVTMGGVKRREGFAYSAKAKYSGLENADVRLIDFRFSSTQAYMLEFGDFYVRFFKDGVPLMDPVNPAIPHELVTPFGIADLDLIKIGSFQSADVMYLCTGIYPVQKLARIAVSPDEFTLSAVSFNPPATSLDSPTGTELNSATLTLSAVTGDGITITAANACWLNGDVGRTLVSAAGRAVITAFTSANILVADVVSDFIGTSIAQDEWHFEGFGAIAVDPTNRLAGQGVGLDAGANIFRPSDVNKYMTIYGGLIKLTAYINGAKMNGVILNTLIDVPNDPASGLPYGDPPSTTVWGIEVEAWSDVLGYPVCGCFFQSRMWLCKGQTINGSVSGDFENFSKGANADDAIQRTIDDDQVNPIRWIKAVRSLQVGTGGSAYEVTASTPGKALSPSDFTVLPISSRGSANIPPIRIGGQLIHVQFGQKKIRELVFDFVTDKFKSPSLLTLAEHLTEDNFLMDAAFQQEPDSIIWLVRNDGMLLALTYQEDENVIAWSTHPTTGAVTSVACIPRPTTGKDWLWASIERDINGVTETFIEHMEPDADLNREWHSLQTDCAVVAVPNTSLVVTGADHLEGATVKVVGDGMLFSDAVVTGGQFTLEPAITVGQVEYGLAYESEGLTCEPLIPPEQGGMFMCRRWKALGMRVRRAGPGLTLNVDDSANVGLPILRPDHPMDAAIPLQEGKLCTEQTNYNPFCRVSFKQTLPFPAEVMNIVGDLEIGTEWCCETVDENPGFGDNATDNNAAVFGSFSRECGHTCPFGQFAQMMYDDGTEAAGIAIRVTTTADELAFTGLAALYLPDQNVIALVLYQNQPLTGIGTVLTSVSAVLVHGDILRIEASDTNADSYTISVNGVPIITWIVLDTDISIANECVAAIQIVDAGTITPPVEEEAMIANQAADLNLTNDTLTDTDMSLLMEANATYVGHVVLRYECASATPDMKFTFVGPALAEGKWFDASYGYLAYDLSTELVYSVSAGFDTSGVFHFTVRNGANAGNLTFQVAQNVTNATPLVVHQDSHMLMFKKV